MFASDSKLPVDGGAAKRTYVRAMFTAIAPTYDRLNRLISLRLDQRWRRIALRELGWERAPRGRYLDLCAGTMDFTALLLRTPGFEGSVVAADFVPQMLQLGRSKAPEAGRVAADALALPFPDNSFDGAVVGWGIRNLIDYDAGLVEIARVLRPGAALVVLEMSQPPLQPLRALYGLYSDHVVPTVGRLISKHTTAYSWLPESARVFPDAPELASRFGRAGFGQVRFRRFLGGVTALHAGVKTAPPSGT